MHLRVISLTQLTTYSTGPTPAPLYPSRPRREWQETRKHLNYPSVISVDTFIQHTSLDELPQFVNVQRGEIINVGQRPTGQADERFQSLRARWLPSPNSTVSIRQQR